VSRSSLLVVLDAIDHLSAPAKKAPWARPEELSWLPAPSPYIRVVLSVRLEAAGSVAGGAVGGQEAADAVCVCVREVYMYMYIRIYIYIRSHIHIYTYAYTYIYVRIYIYIHTHIHIGIHIN